MYFVKRSITLFVLLYFSVKIVAQQPDVTGNFIEADIPISITPEFPSICNPSVGVQVSCNENFSYYIWKHIPSGRILEEGSDKSSVLIKEFTNPLVLPYGKWELKVETEINGLACYKTFEFEIFNLLDPNQIQLYFENAGFFSLPIYREDLPIARDNSEGNRNNNCTISEIKYEDGPNGIIDLKMSIIEVMNSSQVVKELTSEVIVTNNNCLCGVNGESQIQLFEEKYFQDQAALWAHTFFQDDNSNQGVEFAKGRVLDESSLPYKSDNIEFDHFNYLHSINDNVYSENQTTESFSFKFHGNIFLPFPIGGFNYTQSCETILNFDHNIHVVSPSGHPFLLPPNATDVIFSDGSIENVPEGVCLGYSLNNIEFKSHYLVGSDQSIHGGYHSYLKELFQDDLLTPYSEDTLMVGMALENCYDCNFQSFRFLPQTEHLNNSTAGYDYPVLKKIENIDADYKLWFEQVDANKIIYDLMCSIRNGDSEFDLPQRVLNHVVIGYDINIQGVNYEYILLSCPSNETKLYLTNPVFNNLPSANDGFKDALKICSNDEVRLVVYQKKDEDKRDLNRTGQFIDWDGVNFWNIYYKQEVDCKLEPNFFKTNTSLSIYLNNLQNSDNLLLFVNGYRNNGNTELTWDFENSNELVNNCNDNYEKGSYWNSIASAFINRIQNYNVIYADGHYSITTSNHHVVGNSVFESKINFASSAAGCLGAANIRIPLPYKNYAGSPFSCFHNTNPNVDGFLERYEGGKNAGADLYEKIKNGKIEIESINVGNETKITGKIDIVAHSMGYAFAIGIIDYLSPYIVPDSNGKRFGRFYILAPENASTLPNQSNFNIYDFEEVRQYGSNEILEENFKQDGIAPQKAVPGLNFVSGSSNDYGRIPFLGEEKHKNFLDAHFNENYLWVLNKVIVGQNGYVKKR